MAKAIGTYLGIRWRSVVHINPVADSSDMLFSSHSNIFFSNILSAQTFLSAVLCPSELGRAEAKSRVKWTVVVYLYAGSARILHIFPES